MALDFRFARLDEYPRISAFLHEFWAQNHVYCRMRDLFADGVNFYGGTSNSVVEYTHARNTGDDAFASWSPSDHAPNRKNVFKNNAVQVPWMANCFGIYGGEDIVIQDSSYTEANAKSDLGKSF